MPESVPELMAAAVVDSLLAAAMAAMLDATVLVVVESTGVLVLREELAFVLVVARWSPRIVTSCPPDVGKTAEAPEGAESRLLPMRSRQLPSKPAWLLPLIQEGARMPQAPVEPALM